MVDLTDIVIVNESRDESMAGDVAIFQSAAAACRYLEHWWVEDGEGSAFTASGDRLILGVDDRNRVVVVSREAAPDGASLVHSWLRAAATAALEARRIKAARGRVVLSPKEQARQLPSSFEELVAYVGFTD